MSMGSLKGQVVYISTDSLQVEGHNPDLGGNPINSVSGDSVGPRVVFWIHGIAGDLNSWQRVQLVTQNQANKIIPGYPVRNVIGYTADYSQWEDNNPIFDVAALLNEEMEIWRLSRPRTDTLDVRSNFAIAHSQGGIVARSVRYQNYHDSVAYPTQFSHIATFGTPHKGAYIINTTSDTGAVIPWIQDGCNAILPSIINTFIGTDWYNSLVPSRAIGTISKNACSALDKTVIPIFVNSIRKTPGLDYALGSTKLEDTLKPFTLQDTQRTKGVNFYGVEEEPVFWRVLNTMTYTEDTALGAPIIRDNPFGLNDDQRLPNFINGKINDYRNKEVFHSAEARRYRQLSVLSLWPFANVWLSAGLAYLGSNNEQKAVQYYNAHQWLSHANMNWKRFIGARSDTTFIDGYYCECMGWGPNGLDYSFSIVQNPNDCQQNGSNTNCLVNPRIRHQILEKPSDGVVPVESQTGMPGVKSDLKIRMDNTNHMQERNSLATRDRLRELFDGLYGDEFKLDRK